MLRLLFILQVYLTDNIAHIWKASHQLNVVLLIVTALDVKVFLNAEEELQ